MRYFFTRIRLYIFILNKLGINYMEANIVRKLIFHFFRFLVSTDAWKRTEWLPQSLSGVFILTR
jgi:hypothetical protein